MNLSPQDEPARLTGLIVGAASALIALILYFFPADDALVSLIKAVVMTVAPIVAGLIIRRFVTPETTAQEREAAAFSDGYRAGNGDVVLD